LLNYWIRLLLAQRGAKNGPVTRLSPHETLRRIVEENYALSRFGDGELKVALYQRGLRFQRGSTLLTRKLNEVLLEPRDRLLVGYSTRFSEAPEYSFVTHYKRYEKTSNITRTVHYPGDLMVFKRAPQQREYIRHWKIIEAETKRKEFGETTVFFLGLYVDDYVNGTMDEVLGLFRALFNGRRILFVAPEQPLAGESFRGQLETMKRVGLRDAQFITIPRTDAFEHSDAVMKSILDSTGFDDVFLQAGPAATVWAHQLAGRIEGRVLDVGSLNSHVRYLV